MSGGLLLHTSGRSSLDPSHLIAQQNPGPRALQSRGRTVLPAGCFPKENPRRRRCQTAHWTHMQGGFSCTPRNAHRSIPHTSSLNRTRDRVPSSPEGALSSPRAVFLRKIRDVDDARPRTGHICRAASLAHLATLIARSLTPHRSTEPGSASPPVQGAHCPPVQGAHCPSCSCVPRENPRCRRCQTTSFPSNANSVPMPSGLHQVASIPCRNWQEVVGTPTMKGRFVPSHEPLHRLLSKPVSGERYG